MSYYKKKLMNFIVTTTDAATASPHIDALPSETQQKEEGVRACVCVCDIFCFRPRRSVKACATLLRP
jgi:hypothetical protein